MDADELEREARALARPCVYLRDAGSAYAALWEPGDRGGFKLSVSSAWIPDPGWPQPGLVKLVSGPSAATVTFIDGAVLPAEPDGLRLYAHPAASLPPIDAVFLFGSARIQEWLRSFEWPPEAGYDDNFPGRAVVSVYERHYQSQSPLYSGGAHAVLGGWHLPWPDGDWLELVRCQLLVWTFESAEPWVEVWADEGRMWVKQRIT